MNDEPQIEAPPAPSKVDAGTLVLKGRPRPVTRFRRSVIIGGIAALSLTLIVLAWAALKPLALPRALEGETARPFDRTLPDALAAAPRDYRDVPRLGPPLPGDLGRPILEAQRERGPGAADAPSARTEAAEMRALARDAERQARSSVLLAQLGRTTQSGGDREQSPSRAGEPGAGTTSALIAEQSPATTMRLAAGSIIAASLITGLNSDLPGPVIAQVTENVRDTATGQYILVPQGSRLIGRYDTKLAYGQGRASVSWHQLVFPDGSSMKLDDLAASDADGFAGVRDHVDSHGWQVAKGVLISTLLGIGSQLSLGGESDIGRAIRQSTQQHATSAGEQVVSRGLDIKPTVVVRAGWPVRLLLTEELDLPVRGGQSWR